MKAESGLVVAQLDKTEVGLIEIRLVTIRLIAVSLETMRLGRKFKNHLSPKICLNWTILPLELS